MTQALATPDVRSGGAELSPPAFARVARLASSAAGLTIAPTKIAMVQSRLQRRLRALGIASFEEYLGLVEGDGGRGELRQMISVLTTNVSHFFREAHHFETLRKEVLPDLLARARAGERVRLWSAGCSSGQEPLTIAMEVLRLDPQAGERDLRILGTDIDPAILEVARAGRYAEGLMGGVGAEDRLRFFEADGDAWLAGPALRKLVSFRELNLLAPWPMTGRFDVIFCRNVVIYFDEATQRRLWPRFAEALRPGGWMFVGHSERIPDDSGTGFVNTGVTTYRTGIDPAGAGRPARTRKG